MTSEFKKIWGTLIVIGIIAIGGWFSPLRQSVLGSAGDINTTVVKFVKGLKAGGSNQYVLDDKGNITKSPDGFVLWGSFTVSTTSVVRTTLVNTDPNQTPLICSGSTLAVYTSTSGFAPAFKFVVGTTSTAISSTPSNVGYSATLLASTTVATSTVAGTQVFGIPTPWNFLLSSSTSITLSIGDAISNASTTNFGNITGEFSVFCRTTGQ